jgi:hypothetical protein
LTSGKFGSFAHAWQPVMPGAATFVENLAVDASSIVPDPQAKLPFVVVDVYFYPLGVGVPECVAQRLTCNPVDFVPDQRSEIRWRALHIDTKLGAILASLVGSESFTEHAKRPRQVVDIKRGGAQPLHRIATFGDRLPGLLDDLRQLLSGFRVIREQVRHRLKLQ